MKILFTVPYAPNRVRTRPFHLIRALAAAGHNVTVATLWSNAEERAALWELHSVAERVISEPLHLGRKLWNCVRALPGNKPLQSYFSWSPSLARRVAAILDNFDIVHVEHLRGVRYALHFKNALRAHNKRIPIVWDSVDCISDLFRQASQESSVLRSRFTCRFELPRTEKYEAWLTSQFKRVLVTSDSDRRSLLKLSTNLRKHSFDISADPADRVVVIPNGVDLSYFSQIDVDREPYTLVISGKMSYHANVTAVVQFVRRVMPQLWNKNPTIRLWVVGRNPPAEIRDLGVPWLHSNGDLGGRNADDRIRITGTVDDIRPYLQRATIAVAPIEYGVGIQNKVLESMACGTPVVATPSAAKALGVHSGKELIIARTADELATTIAALLEDAPKRKSLSAAGRHFVEQSHDWNVIARHLARTYEDART